MAETNYAGPAAFGGMIASAIGGRKARAQQWKMQGRQHDFQQRMSSTAHQRATVDLENAGLNRILSVSQGGASSPAGGQGAKFENIGASIASTAKEAGLAAAQLRNINASTDKTKAETDVVKAKTPKEALHGRGYEVLNRIADQVPSTATKAKQYYDQKQKTLNQKAQKRLDKRKPLPEIYQAPNGRWYIMGKEGFPTSSKSKTRQKKGKSKR